MARKDGNRAYNRVQSKYNEMIKICDNIKGRGHRMVRFLVNYGNILAGEEMMIDECTITHLLPMRAIEIMPMRRNHR